MDPNKDNNNNNNNNNILWYAIRWLRSLRCRLVATKFTSKFARCHACKTVVFQSFHDQSIVFLTGKCSVKCAYYFLSVRAGSEVLTRLCTRRSQAHIK